MGVTREHVERAIELWNRGDLDALVPLTAPDVTSESPLGDVTGVHAANDQDRAGLVAFPDRRIKPQVWSEDGDTVIVEGEWSGTHTGPFALPNGTQLPPTGQRVTFRTVSVFEVRDGKTVARRLYFDQLPAMMQLGLVALVQRP